LTVHAIPVAGTARLTFTVDPWDPGYGQAFAEENDSPGGLSESSAELELDFEVPADQWQPIDPDPNVVPPGQILFLDGVRRIDAGSGYTPWDSATGPARLAPPAWPASSRPPESPRPWPPASSSATAPPG